MYPIPLAVTFHYFLSHFAFWIPQSMHLKMPIIPEKMTVYHALYDPFVLRIYSRLFCLFCLGLLPLIGHYIYITFDGRSAIWIWPWILSHRHLSKHLLRHNFGRLRTAICSLSSLYFCNLFYNMLEIICQIVFGWIISCNLTMIKSELSQ